MNIFLLHLILSDSYALVKVRQVKEGIDVIKVDNKQDFNQCFAVENYLFFPLLGIGRNNMDKIVRVCFRGFLWKISWASFNESDFTFGLL